MKLSDEMRDMMTPPFPEGTNFIGVGKETVLAWASRVARLERVVEVTRVQNSMWHSPVVTEALKELEE